MTSGSLAPAPIFTAHLFKELDRLLLDLLKSLSPDEWQRPTIVPKWNVAQVTAHLLDTALRRLAFGRDRWMPRPPVIRSEQDLVDFVNGLNARGVEVFGQLSPRVLISLMEVAVTQLSDYLEALDPFAPSSIPVSWAGERESQNWFDIARELTERWHHQQQIRLAVDRPGIMTPRLYAPVLDCFMRALPHVYRNTTATPGAVARIIVAGDCGGTWFVQRQTTAWGLVTSAETERVVSTTTLPQEIAWRVFTKGISRADAEAHTSIEGDERIGCVVLSMVSIVG